MMFSSSLFSLGLILPLLLLFVGHVAIGLLFSGAAIVARFQADSEPAAARSRRRVDWAIAILAASVLSSILGACLVHIENKLVIAECLIIVGWFFLWPVSAVLTVWGRGVARRALLVGHGLIALLLVGLLICVWIHEFR
jgi:hypothetical protein